MATTKTQLKERENEIKGLTDKIGGERKEREKLDHVINELKNKVDRAEHEAERAR